jgi:hypothetical protein
MMPGGTSGQPLSHDLSVQSESAFFYLLVGSVSHRLSSCKINVLQNKREARDGILGHQFNKRLESFASCYSQSLLLADFKETILFSGFSNHYKKNREKKKTRVYSLIAFCRAEKWG